MTETDPYMIVKNAVLMSIEACCVHRRTYSKWISLVPQPNFHSNPSKLQASDEIMYCIDYILCRYRKHLLHLGNNLGRPYKIWHPTDV